ncbi:unnamed protein product [Calicophoron daubneyi]|uniref:Uncharacterized protein n=1 Tax=Calicophoron daubneyi TaxID=300641 RepID=A0AAV2TD19_CALDB
MRPTISHLGKFDVGSPESCDATIADDPEAATQATFVNEPVVTSQQTDRVPTQAQALPPDKGPESDVSPSQSRSTRRIMPTYMNRDHLSRIFSYPPMPPVLIRINVSGVKFHVMHSTLLKDPFVFGKMLDDAMWLPEEREYYFPRDPNVFVFIHNYLRRGELHLPHGMCGPLLEKELDEWGIPLGMDVQRCCLGSVMETKFRMQSLRKFERHMETKIIRPHYWIKSPRWQSLCENVWKIIDDAPKFIHAPNIVKERRRSAIEFLQRKLLGNQELKTPKNASNISEYAEVDSDHPSEGNHTRDDKKKDTTMIIWLRRGYVTCESLIVTATVVLFFLSTLDSFRMSPSETYIKGFSLNNSELENNVSSAYSRKRSTVMKPWLLKLDFFFSFAITADVLMRMIFCPTFKSWIFSIYTLIDLLSLVPFYFETVMYIMALDPATNTAREVAVWFIDSDIYVLKVFIVLRLVRVLRRNPSTRILLYTIRTTAFDVGIIIVLLLECGLLFGTAAYFMEDKYPNVPIGTWWAMITMTSVGYGDIVPATAAGCALSVACVLVGTILLGYMIPILVERFMLFHNHADILYMIKQLHRTAKHKVRNRSLSSYAQKALSGARELMSVTLTGGRSVMMTSANVKVSDLSRRHGFYKI